MAWKVVERNIGRAGSLKRRTHQQREWDKKYGEGMWEVGYVINGSFVPQREAVYSVYYKSYENHFNLHPEDIKELIALAKKLKNPHAEATTGVDLQVPAIMKYLEENNLKLKGTQIVDIGTWKGQRSHPISERLSPLQIKCVLNDKMTLEKWWQKKKCLAVWVDE